MSKPLVTDEFWALVQPILPEHHCSPKGGRPRVDDRVCLSGIIFVLKTGIPWEEFPCEMGCCGMTLWNRLAEWTNAGVWPELHGAAGSPPPPRRLGPGQGHRRFLFGPCDARGKKTGPNPVDRAKPGSKHHFVVDARGTPLAATVTGANQHDVTQLLPLIDAIPPIRGKVGAPRSRPDEAYADRAYDSEPHRGELRNRKIKPFLAKRNTEHGSGLGVIRTVVEQTVALAHQFRRLKMRFDKRDDIHEAFLTLADIVICWRRPGRVMRYF